MMLNSIVSPSLKKENIYYILYKERREEKERS
jgi:hypothetical protein